MSQENVEAVRQGYAGFAENRVEGVIPFFTSGSGGMGNQRARSAASDDKRRSE